MGVELCVEFGPGGPPEWEAIRARLSAAGHEPTLRMIDGLPAFPDELPPPEWQELRVSLGAGMVTVRRDRLALRCLVWGNADAVLRREWEAVAWACAAAGAGSVVLPEGPVDAEAFLRTRR